MAAGKNGVDDYADLYDLFESEGEEETAVPVRRNFSVFAYIAVILCTSFALLAGVVVIDFKSGDLAVGAPAEDAPPYLVVTFLDVGQGDAIFIRTPDNYTVLIDAGERGNEYSPFDAGKEVVLPYLKKNGIEKLDTVVMTHAHSDHVGGLLQVLDNIKVGEVLEPAEPYSSGTYKTFVKKIKKKKIKYRPVTKEGFEPVQKWGNQVFAQVLYPPRLAMGTDSDTNNNSVVIYMRYGTTSFLFTGDVETEGEWELTRYGKDIKNCTVMKIPHHGSDTSSSPRFMKLVKPRWGVIMVARGNKFGLPAPKICEEYVDMGTKLLRTDYNGTITFVSNGSEVRVFKERG